MRRAPLRGTTGLCNRKALIPERLHTLTEGERSCWWQWWWEGAPNMGSSTSAAIVERTFTRRTFGEQQGQHSGWVAMTDAQRQSQQGGGVMMMVWNARNASQQADNFTSHNVSWMSLSSFEEARRVLLRSGLNRPSRSGSSTNADLDAYQYVDDRRGFLGSGSVHSYRRPRSAETPRLSFETAPTPAMGRRRSRGRAGPEREMPTDDDIPDLVSGSESDSSDEEGTSAWATRRATRRRQPSLLRWQPRRPPWGIWERTLDAEPQVHRLTKANPRTPPLGAGTLKDPERRSQREPHQQRKRELYLYGTGRVIVRQG